MSKKVFIGITKSRTMELATPTNERSPKDVFFELMLDVETLLEKTVLKDYAIRVGWKIEISYDEGLLAYFQTKSEIALLLELQFAVGESITSANFIGMVAFYGRICDVSGIVQPFQEQRVKNYFKD